MSPRQFNASVIKTPTAVRISMPVDAAHQGKGALLSMLHTLKRGLVSAPDAAGRARLAVQRPLVARVRRPAALVAGTFATLAFAAALPSPARAADYRVWACAAGSGTPLSVGNWTRNVSADLADVQTNCAEPTTNAGALVSTARATSAWGSGGGGWVVAAAPGTRISSLDLWWSWQVLAGRPSGAVRVIAPGTTYAEPNAGLDPFDHVGLCCSNTAFIFRHPGNFGKATTTDPTVALGDSNHQSFTNLIGPDGHPGIPAVGVVAVCWNYCSSGATVAKFQAYRVKTVIQDDTAPAGASSGLTDGLRVGSGTPIKSTASDVGGGVREITLRVDERVVERASGGANCADVDPSNSDPLEYNLMKPCPSTLAVPLTLSAGQMPDNETHAVTVVATDAAGQSTVLSSAQAALAAPAGFYDTKNGFYNPDLSVTGGRKTNGANATGGAKLKFGFVRGHRTVKRQIARYAARPRIRGRVRAANKRPVAGARVWRAVRARDGHWRISGKALRASRSGRVSARLPSRTPSRDVRLVYFPYTDTNVHTSSPDRELLVQAKSTLQVNQGGYRNGDVAKFSGRVIKKGLIPNKTVYMQAIVRGQWKPFGTTRTDAKGRWRIKHRFEATRRPTIYTFRAVVPSQTGYGWATGYSRKLRVLVTP